MILNTLVVKIVLAIFVCFFSYAAFAQTNLLFHKVDTLKAEFRSGGKSNDSLDVYFAEKQTTLPGGTQNNPFGIHGNDYFNFFQSLNKQHRSIKIGSPIFTALPHLGFMYSVGSGGLQYLHTDYQQTFRSNIHLNMQYNRQVSATLYKQSDYSSDEFTLSLARFGKRWKHLVEGAASSGNRSLNGGVVSDDKMLQSYGLEYAPVVKTQTRDSSKRYYLHQQSVWNFLPLDSVRKVQTGLVFDNHIRVDQRIFKETDSISKLYTFFSNPTITRDLAQWSCLENGVALFFKSTKQTSELGLNRVYWIYKTNASEVKNALNVTLHSQWNFARTKVDFALLQNLSGLGNQFSHTLQLTNEQKYGVHQLEVANSKLVPDPIQRLYYGNTIAWKIPKIEKQGVFAVAYMFSGKSKFKPVLKVGYKHLENTYFLVKDTWRNDTLTQIEHLYLRFSCDFSVGKFHIQPWITYNRLNKEAGSLLPNYDVRGRFFWKTALKQREKYEVIVGTDVYTRSSYSLMNFDSSWGLFSIDNPTKLTYTSVVQLDAFVGISIDELRFYFKYENIDNSWNPVTNRVSLGYPVMPKILRIGLTWDFLN